MYSEFGNLECLTFGRFSWMRDSPIKMPVLTYDNATQTWVYASNLKKKF
jgi:hypothetical protein